MPRKFCRRTPCSLQLHVKHCAGGLILNTEFTTNQTEFTCVCIVNCFEDPGEECYVEEYFQWGGGGGLILISYIALRNVQRPKDRACLYGTASVIA